VSLVVFTVKDKAGDPLLALQGTHAADDPGGSSHASHEHRHRFILAGAGRKQVHGVDGPRLSQTFDSPDALLETDRRPRQLEIDHQSAALVEVQSFAGGVGREEQARAAGDELLQHFVPFGGRHPAVKQHGREVT
jgi:hypothetical protein